MATSRKCRDFGNQGCMLVEQKFRHCLRKPAYLARYWAEKGAKLAKFARFCAFLRGFLEERIAQYQSLAKQ
jgi:hypothetical protein